MADKLMYPIGSFKYANRMMKAGDDPVLMNARDQKVFTALGRVSATPPAKAKAAPPVGDATEPRTAANTGLTVTAKPAAKKKAPRRKKAK